MLLNIYKMLPMFKLPNTQLFIEKRFLWIFILSLMILIWPMITKANSPPGDSTNFMTVHEDWEVMLRTLFERHKKQEAVALLRLENINQQKKILFANGDIAQYMLLLEEQTKAYEDILQARKLMEVDMLKVRYQKGISLIKLIYEKLLSLDHHFSGMKTLQNVALLSNPHNYPEFRKINNVIEKQTDKKYAFNLPSMLNSNPYLTATYSLVSSILRNGRTEEKEADFQKISCILDFTVRMNGDLNIIRHETDYLQTANLALKADCEQLFGEYTKFLGYYVPLEKCRNNDDWETLAQHLDKFILQLEQNTGNTNEQTSRMEVNIIFATERVAEFVSQYSAFINQGMQYYQKFDNIISSYENQDFCEEQLPRQFNELKFDIKSTIEKYKNTYNLPEIHGSRLKNLLYGRPDF